MNVREHPCAPGFDAADDEATLVVAARHRDEAAVRELIRRLNPRLFRVARGILPSDAEAEEAVQEAYLTAFTRLPEFRGEARFSTWITRITINAALMQARRARPHEELDCVDESDIGERRVLTFPGQDPARPEAALAQSQARFLLEEAIGGLPSDLRLPFIMKETEGMSVLSISRHLSLNPVTVRTRLFRARRRLRAVLEERLRGGFDAVFPFDGARCSGMADRVVARLKATGAI